MTKKRIGKKLITVLLAVALVETCVSVLGAQTAYAYADNIITSGDYSYTILDDGSACIIGYSGTSSHVEYPSYIDGKKVTRVGREDSLISRGASQAVLLAIVYP